jgi:hypothetical protein
MKLDVIHANDRDRVLLTIQQLVGPALAWWQSYEVNPEARNMVWDDFVKLFREHHIPNSVMKLKRQESMSLQQRNLSVTEYLHKFTELSCYAPYEVDTDKKKQDSFLHGLDSELRTLIGAGIYPDFNTMVNRTITTAKNKQDEMRDKKRKFEAKKTFSGEDHEAAAARFLQPEELQQGLVPSSYCVVPTTHPPCENSRIFPEAADRRQPNEQPEGMLQLQRDWPLHCQLSVPEGDSISLLQLCEWAEADDWTRSFSPRQDPAILC